MLRMKLPGTRKGARLKRTFMNVVGGYAGGGRNRGKRQVDGSRSLALMLPRKKRQIKRDYRIKQFPL